MTMTRSSSMRFNTIILSLCVAFVDAAKEGKTKARQGGCSLCPDGEAVGFPNRNIPTTNTMCKDSDFLNVSPYSAMCDDFRKSAAWCGCSSAPQECFLCEGEESSPTPELESPIFPDVACLDYEYIASQLSAEECPSLSERSGSFDIAAYCSCEDTEAPTVCELCPAGEIGNPQDQSVVAGLTCERADQELLQFFTDKSLCIEFRQLLLFDDRCVCIGSTDYPTQAPTGNSPTAPPTKTPSTPSPTDPPSTSPPTKTPTTSSPTRMPTTPSPTRTPTTQSPTKTPTTTSPTRTPTTPSPTKTPTTPSPTRTPTTASPTRTLTTPPPTGALSTSSPTSAAVSTTSAPSTSMPTSTAPSPTRTPTSPSTTKTPTSPPTKTPTGPSPTRSPTTPSPTSSAQQGSTSSPTSTSAVSPTNKSAKNATDSPTAAPKRSFKGSTKTNPPSTAPTTPPETTAPTAAKSSRKQSKKEGIVTTKKLKTKKEAS